MGLTVVFIAAFIASCTCKAIENKTGHDCTNQQIVEVVTVNTHIQCKENNAHPRIVKGCEAEPHSLPWQVYIGGCGGSVLDEDTILTAAHCCESKEVGDSVLAGKHDLSNKYEESTQEALVTDVIIHPGYEREPFPRNDVCIIKLERPLEMNDYVKAVKLPEYPGIDFDGIAAVSGWGRTNDDSIPSEKLRVARVPLVDFKTCADVWGQPDQFCESQMICAGNGGADTCQGDSGGPMMCDDVICGITSFGDEECGVSIGVYARVSNYLEFIMEHL